MHPWVTTAGALVLASGPVAGLSPGVCLVHPFFLFDVLRWGPHGNSIKTARPKRTESSLVEGCGSGGMRAHEGDDGASGGRERESVSPSPALDVLYQDQDGAVLSKPPMMHVHRPEFGSKDKEFVLQKAREQLGKRVNFPHRLDRGTSGCLMLSFTPEGTMVLQRALGSPRARKLYVALVRGSGSRLVDRGWFEVDRPIKDEKNIEREASTRFLFIAGSSNPRCCLVLAQPQTGRFHQIRRHLNGLSHPVVGDCKHGDTRFNREFCREYGAPRGRLFLHCMSIALPPTGDPAWADPPLSGPRAPLRAQVPDSPGLPETLADSGRGGFSVMEVGETGPGGCLAEGRVAGSLGLAEGGEGLGIEARPWAGAGGRDRLHDQDRAHISGARYGGGVGGRRDEMEAWRGMEVTCPLPADMAEVLRGMPWWKEGMMEEAAATVPGAGSSDPVPPVLPLHECS
ncbi:unnamed protein product, partial [Discosporangium mesarthrocarpum]